MKSERRSGEPTLCLELSFDYASRSHPLFVEAQGCVKLSRRLTRKEEKQVISYLRDELVDRITEMFGIGVLSTFTDQGVYYGGEEGIRIMWNHGYLSGMRSWEDTLTLDEFLK
ncbi:hypothetical protein [Metallosphaera sp.]|uniref:hypothetical protein n=1 Tax=Metallosphaera sp. TaxID=2020860 RepID=UPI003165DD85